MQAVLFDLDETLLDRKKSLFDFVTWQANKQLCADLGSKRARFIHRFIALDANGMLWKDKVYTSLIQEFEIEGWSVTDLLYTYELAFCSFCQPKKGAIEAVKTLSSLGYKLGLVSNGKSPFQERNFNALGISALFDVILVSESQGMRKPEKELFELASSKIGVTVNNCVFVGDNPEADIAGANNAGMYSIYIPGHYGPMCEYASVVCSDLSNLVALVEKA